MIDGSRLVLSGRGVTNRYAPSFVRIYVIRHSLSAICIAKVLGDVVGTEPWLTIRPNVDPHHFPVECELNGIRLAPS